MIKYLLLLCCLISYSAYAQNSVNKKAQKNFDQAQEFLIQQNYTESIKYLDEAVKLDSNFQLAYIQLGDIYSRLKSYDKAKINYKNAINSLPNIEDRIYYALGEIELLTGNYENAKVNFKLFQSKYTGGDQKLIGGAKKYILDCEFSEVAIKNPSKYELINIGSNINSLNREYFPTLTADGETIIFTRVIKDNEDLFIAQKIKNEWQNAKPLSDQINSTDYNEGAQSISPDGKYIFFTGCNKPDGLGRCDIYVSRKQGNNWGKATNLGKVINSEYWESQPAISPDGNTLYFVSNRPGGFGGYDIWKSTFSDQGEWSTPVNLGPNINTVYDENTPFIHADGKTLYFSSNGWPGLGNKDVFFSQLDEEGMFKTPINLGYPINTFNEEIGLFVSADGSEGLFSSNAKEGFGDLDIYKFKLPTPFKPSPVTYVKGIVKDRTTNQLLESAVLIINLKNNTSVYNDFTAKETGDFLAVMPIGNDYSLNVTADGYLFNSMHFSLKIDSLNAPYQIEIFLDKIEVGNSVSLQNIFFETNKYELLTSSISELALLIELLHTNQNLEIEIEGHTDNSGDQKLNAKLSENRAKSVYNFLVENGIDKKRLSYKGFGSTKPRSNNSSEQGRKENRRTEFIITKI